MELSSLSVTDLNLMTKDQIVTALTEDRIDTRTTVSTGDKRGQLREVRETRDLKGSLVSSQEVNWTYFKNGNVDTITVVDKNAEGVEISRKVVKHNEGGGLANTAAVKAIATATNDFLVASGADYIIHGGQEKRFDISNLSSIYVNAVTSGQLVSYLGLVE